MTMLLLPAFLFLALFVLGARGNTPSRNITTSSSVFLSYNEYNSNAVYEAWKGPGELSLLFKSRKPTAFLAYQDDGTYSHFDLFLINGKVRARVTFDKCQWKQLTIEGNFSDSRWHRVRLARQLNNVTLTVDGCYSESIECNYTSSKSEKWQALYVGSIPWEISMNSLAKPGIFRETIESVFQGCIGHVTQTAPGESPKPLALRSSAWTGSDCGRNCASDGKCNPIDEVTRKECECPRSVNEELICKLHSSRSNTNLAHTIKASSSSISQSAQMVFSSKGTPVLSSSSQTNVKATSSSKIAGSSTPTRTQTASEHAQDSSGVKAQYVDVVYLNQSSSVPGKASHSQQPASVPAPTSSFSLVALPFSKVNVSSHSSVDNNSSTMAKKSKTVCIQGSFILTCLALTVAILSDLVNQ
ncbi:uncharacterized protein LOC144646604 [Oculina patagonica]